MSNVIQVTQSNPLFDNPTSDPLKNQHYSYYSDIGLSGDLAQAVVSEIRWLLTKGEGIKQHYLKAKFGLSDQGLYKILRKAKDAGLISWQLGNGKRRHSFTLTKPITSLPLTYSQQELEDAGSYRQAACNNFLKKVCHGELPSNKRIAAFMGCGASKAKGMKEQFKRNYPQKYPQAVDKGGSDRLKREVLGVDKGGSGGLKREVLISNNPRVNTLSNNPRVKTAISNTFTQKKLSAFISKTTHPPGEPDHPATATTTPPQATGPYKPLSGHLEPAKSLTEPHRTKLGVTKIVTFG